MDFFHVWLRRALWGLSPAIDAAFDTPLGPKWNAGANDGELIDDAARFGGDRAVSKRNYEDGMARAFSHFHAALRDDGRLVIVFANKSPDAWETLVSALIRAGFVVDGSWPIQTERLARTRAMQSAALASSIWIVCRKRPAARAGWDTAVLTQMRENISQQLRDFWDAGIRGPDFVWAATGPALEAFSKYPAVKRADDADSQMTVSEFLRAVRRFVVDFVVGRVLTHDGADEATSGLDDVTTYYLLHRNDFGLGDAPIGACILYAISCNLSDRDLTDRYDVLSRGARASERRTGRRAGRGGGRRRAGRSRRRQPGQAEDRGAGAPPEVARQPDAGRPSSAADRPGAPADALLARRRGSEGQRLSRRTRPEAPRSLRAAVAVPHRAGRRRIRRTRDPGIALEPHRGARRRRARPAADAATTRRGAMITSLRLVDFKNFADETLWVGPFTVIVGANASGKSNIRDAFRFLHGIGRGYTLAEILGGKYGPGGQAEWRGVRGAPNEVGRVVRTEAGNGFALQVRLEVGDSGWLYLIEVARDAGDASGFRVIRESLSHGSLSTGVGKMSTRATPSTAVRSPNTTRHVCRYAWRKRAPNASRDIRSLYGPTSRR